MGDIRQRISETRLVIIVALIFISLGALGFGHATSRLRAAESVAEHHTGEVHLSTRIFFDWLDPASIDHKLDSMTLRRVALLEASRAHRLQGISLLALLAGCSFLLLANAARILEEGVTRLPDQSWEDGAVARAGRKQAKARLQRIRAGSGGYGFELLRQPAS